MSGDVTTAEFWTRLITEGAARGAHLPGEFDVDAESRYYASLAIGPLHSLLASLEIEQFLGAGGAGTVFLARSSYAVSPHAKPRAVKLPREAFAREVHSTQSQPLGAAAVNVEVDALDRLYHPNIVRLHDAARIDASLDAVVMGYISDSRDLDVYLRSQLDSDPQGTHIADHLETLARLLLETCDALAYMHDRGGLYHFDLKPSNILVDGDGHAYLSDMGFARDRAPKGDVSVTIGFTWRYAHRDLRNPYDVAARVSRTPAKCKAVLTPDQLSPRFDLFALGRTLQECLWFFWRAYGDQVYAHYTFNYLHLLACLCLDGKNTAASEPEIGVADRGFVSDTALRYPTSFFVAHKFTKAADVLDRIRRLLGMVQIEASLPELNRWLPSITNASDFDYVPLTERVEAVTEHPAFVRLNEERQLGLLRGVYPTATHTRANHSLGSFLGVCLYLEALYFDPDVPTFKVVSTDDDFRLAMVAALVHDIAQTSLGHDLEEVSEDVFSHERFVYRLLTDVEMVDDDNRTLAAVISGSDKDCWNVPLDDVLMLLARQPRRPLDGVLIDCINGAIDADKLDYLVRDSVDCRVTYGRGIDVRRFLRALTMTVQGSDERCRAYLSVRSKGFAAVQSLVLARYEMHCALYWQHTFRAVKSMVLDAAARGFADGWGKRGKPQTDLFTNEDIKDIFYAFVICRRDWDDSTELRRDGKPATQRRREVETPPPTVRREPALDMLWRLGDRGARALVERVVHPDGVYKRVFEWPVSNVPKKKRDKLQGIFSRERRIETREKVREKIQFALEYAAQARAETATFRKDDVLAELALFADDDTTVTIDCPLRAWVPTGSSPFTMPDYKRKFFQPAIAASERNTKFWEETLYDLMMDAATVRVFCSPAYHRLVTRLLTAEKVTKAIQDALPGLFADDVLAQVG